MEIYGLDPEGGEVQWRRRPAGRSFSGSFTNDLLASEDAGFIGGSVSRARTLPVLRAYDAEGRSPWKGAAGKLQSGVVTALALHDGTILATGSAGTIAKPGQNVWLRATDATTGVALWEEIRPRGVGDSAGSALAFADGYVALAAVLTAKTGELRWLLRVYRPS
jgi:outer membrane protein assembly factor BamB